MSEPLQHLSALSLEQLVEGTLPEAEASAARSHLHGCERCSAELDGYRALFAMLEELPRFAPSTAFADAVMARVQIKPRESALAMWLRRFVPTTRRGWVLLGTLVTAPATPLLALVALMLIQPLVTPTTLWQWGVLRVQALGGTIYTWTAESFANLLAADWFMSVYTTLAGIPAGAVFGSLLLLSAAIPLSAWGLVRLTRTPGQRVTYAN